MMPPGNMEWPLWMKALLVIGFPILVPIAAVQMVLEDRRLKQTAAQQQNRKQ